MSLPSSSTHLTLPLRAAFIPFPLIWISWLLFILFVEEGQQMPTPNRREFIRNKVRREFRASVALKDDKDIAELILIGNS